MYPYISLHTVHYSYILLVLYMYSAYSVSYIEVVQDNILYACTVLSYIQTDTVLYIPIHTYNCTIYEVYVSMYNVSSGKRFCTSLIYMVGYPWAVRRVRGHLHQQFSKYSNRKFYKFYLCPSPKFWVRSTDANMYIMQQYVLLLLHSIEQRCPRPRLSSQIGRLGLIVFALLLFFLYRLWR